MAPDAGSATCLVLELTQMEKSLLTSSGWTLRQCISEREEEGVSLVSFPLSVVHGHCV